MLNNTRLVYATNFRCKWMYFLLLGKVGYFIKLYIHEYTSIRSIIIIIIISIVHCSGVNLNAFAVWIDPALKFLRKVVYDRTKVATISNLSGELSAKTLAGSIISMLEQMSFVQLFSMKEEINSALDEKVYGLSLVDPYCIDVSHRTFVLATDLLSILSK